VPRSVTLVGLAGNAKTGLGGVQIKPASQLAKLDAHHPALQVAEALERFRIEP
jgi:hypothetical protein